MNKKYIVLLIYFLGLFSVKTQIRMDFAPAHNKVNAVQNVDYNNMSFAEKKQLIRQYREAILIDDLKIPENSQENFKKIYREYQEKQHKIRAEFNNNFDIEHLTADEAKQKLEESFKIGERLLENRREYAAKLQSVLTPQQILKMFQNEGQLREKMIERKMQLKGKR